MQHQALKFITCGSVDDGKSTLIGRLLIDSKAVLQDQLAGVSKSGAADLALFTDGLSAEREQGITIDVAYRYFATPARKFIIGDAPGHEQYTRNMVTAASSADAAVVLVDATKLDWKATPVKLLPQTRRHSLLLKLLRVPSVVFAVNKLDAIDDAATAFQNISAALKAYAQDAGIAFKAIVPISALNGDNVVTPSPGFAGVGSASLLDILETLPAASQSDERTQPLSFPVQWVEKFSSSSDTSQGRRVFWGRVATGGVQVGQEVEVFPSGQRAVVAQVLNHVREATPALAGASAGIVLDREVDVSRGDWLMAVDSFEPQRSLDVTVAWLDDTPLVAGRTYWLLQGHRWTKAKVTRVAHRVDIHTLAQTEASELAANDIGHITLALQSPLPARAYTQAKSLGSAILVDTASHKTSGALMFS
jgi:sulfate adenylyltransferase subunit 1